MARGKKSVEEEPFQSQSSNGSEEQSEKFRKAFAKLCVQEHTKEDRTLLNKIAKEFNQELVDVASEIEESLKKSHECWTSSIVDYSAIEDRICRAIIEMRQCEDDTLKYFSDLQTELSGFVQHDAERFSGLEGLQEACQDFGALLDQLSASAD